MKRELLFSKESLEHGRIIAFPTETVMGFGVFYDDYRSYKLLNKVKRRPEDKPYTLMLSSIGEIEKYAYLTKRDKKIIARYMPGPLTVLLRAKDVVPGYVTHNTGIIGIRVPDMDYIREMIAYLGKPLLVPSANRSGEPPFTEYEDVINEFKDEIGYVYPKNALGNKPSTIIDLTSDTIKLIRQGDISVEEIERETNMLRIAIGSDHGGFDAKKQVIEYLKKQNIDVVDCGTYSLESCDYPIFGKAAAEKVASQECDYGVVICTSGEGIMIAANKVPGIRCGLAYNDDVARLMRQHNNANMIAFGAKFMDIEDIKRRIDIFLSTEFEGGRHERRVKEIE